MYPIVTSIKIFTVANDFQVPDKLVQYLRMKCHFVTIDQGPLNFEQSYYVTESLPSYNTISFPFYVRLHRIEVDCVFHNTHCQLRLQ